MINIHRYASRSSGWWYKTSGVNKNVQFMMDNLDITTDCFVN